jgi:hypothetical protein
MTQANPSSPPSIHQQRQDSTVSASSSNPQNTTALLTSTATPTAPLRNVQSKTEARAEFKKLARWYLKNHKPPSDKQMQRLQELRGQYDWQDVITWQDEVGLKRVIMFDDETGEIIFDEWPTAPHETLIVEFTRMFDKQFVRPWDNSPLHPIFEGEGIQGNVTQTFFRAVS